MTNPTGRDELVERVARAIWTSPITGQPVGKEVRPWPPRNSDALIETMNQARAALTTIEASRNDGEIERLREALAEARDLVKRVRALVRAENARIHEARVTGKDVTDCGSRDEADFIQVNLYTAWPAKRLDALLSALSHRKGDGYD